MAGAVHDGRAVPPEPIGRREQRAAETLDLQRATGLGAEALDEPVRSEHEERHDHRCGHAHERSAGAHCRVASRRPPDEDESGRHEHERIDLRREREPEQREPDHA